MQLNTICIRLAWFAAAGSFAVSAWGAVLPEDRADLMYHYYKGGGTEVDGPALLVRKGVSEQTSVYASYYTDSISGASIDVITMASPYKEKREERTIGLDFLHRNTTTTFSYSTSDERDYLASTVGVNIAHEVFDGLTTISMGYMTGRDQVSQVETTFQQDINRYHYKFGLAQVFTKSFLMNLEYESILEDGYLNSPYRAARLQGLLIPEHYPRTRDSNAVAIRAIKGLASTAGDLQASLHLGYRYFSDTWDIRAHTVEVGYQRRLGERWTIEPHYRYYTQTAASFYSDNFVTPMTYMARDKELSTFKSHSLGMKAGYKLFEQRFGMDRATVNFSYDYIRFFYADFTDMRTNQPYDFGAHVVQIFVSAWY